MINSLNFKEFNIYDSIIYQKARDKTLSLGSFVDEFTHHKNIYFTLFCVICAYYIIVKYKELKTDIDGYSYYNIHNPKIYIVILLVIRNKNEPKVLEKFGPVIAGVYIFWYKLKTLLMCTLPFYKIEAKLALIYIFHTYILIPILYFFELQNINVPFLSNFVSIFNGDNWISWEIFNYIYIIFIFYEILSMIFINPLRFNKMKIQTYKEYIKMSFNKVWFIIYIILLFFAFFNALNNRDVSLFQYMWKH